MKKTLFIYVLPVIVLTQLVGCATVQKKFTRKKKEPAHVTSTIYVDKGPYQKKFSNSYYYTTHYTQWQAWHGELIDELNGNRKRATHSAQEAQNHLSAMLGYLKPEKQLTLKPELDSLSSIVHRMELGTLTSSEMGGIRVELEGIKRRVEGGFYHSKIKDDILPDEVLTQ